MQLNRLQTLTVFSIYQWQYLQYRVTHILKCLIDGDYLFLNIESNNLMEQIKRGIKATLI